MQKQISRNITMKTMKTACILEEKFKKDDNYENCNGSQADEKMMIMSL